MRSFPALRPTYSVAYFVCAAVFIWGVVQFYSPVTGFTSLLLFGDARLDRTEVTALWETPHYVYEGWGYDGAHYAQIALHPTLDNPELEGSVDNLAYRARRILFCWAAWALGLGKPAWVLNAYALLNVFAWLALAVMLTRWFPPTDAESFFRWFGVMFSSGMIVSVRRSLVDAPSLLLVAFAMIQLERGKRGPGMAVLSLAALGRETSLLAMAGAVTGNLRMPRTWSRFARSTALAALPLLFWMGYLRWKLGVSEAGFAGNFGVPLAGFAQKWSESFAAAAAHLSSLIEVTDFATVIALAVQFLFFAVRRRPYEAWWRVGASYAFLMALLGAPVWEGFPTAAPRVLLPMLLAFNITVPRGRWWLPLLIAGNLSVFTAYIEFSPPCKFSQPCSERTGGWHRTLTPAPDIFELYGERSVLAALRVEPVGDWHEMEKTAEAQWRWSKGEGGFRFHNTSNRALTVMIYGELRSAEVERRVQAFVGPTMVRSEEISPKWKEMSFSSVLPPGDTEIMFKTDLPPLQIPTDSRLLAFSLWKLKIFLKLA